MDLAFLFSQTKSLEMETNALKSTLCEMEKQVKDSIAHRDIFLSYLSLKADVSSRLKRVMEMRKEIYSIIDKIENPTHKTLLTYRYINGETMEKCAELMNFEERHIYRVHKKALLDAEKAANIVDLN